MPEHDPEAYKKMVRSYQKRDEPTGWFDQVYRVAGGDYKAVFWADLEPSPYLMDWLAQNTVTTTGKQAIVVGCGVGDDAEALAEQGYEVTGFDISPSAIELCQKRYPESKVGYLVADLFNYDKAWFRAFDLVFECNTIQVLPGQYRIQAREAIADLVAPTGYVLVSCRSREAGEQEQDIPLPLDRAEMDGFVRSGLIEQRFIAYDDEQDPPVPHFFASYMRKA